MSEPIWLDVDEVIDMHAEQLAIFGGPEGLRDHGLLESAVMRPVNQWSYGQTDMAALAAAYAFGIARNHAFVRQQAHRIPRHDGVFARQRHPVCA